MQTTMLLVAGWAAAAAVVVPLLGRRLRAMARSLVPVLRGVPGTAAELATGEPVKAG